MGNIIVPSEAKAAYLEAKIIRANGKEENLGIIASYERLSLLKRIKNNLRRYI